MSPLLLGAVLVGLLILILLLLAGINPRTLISGAIWTGIVGGLLVLSIVLTQGYAALLLLPGLAVLARAWRSSRRGRGAAGGGRRGRGGTSEVRTDWLHMRLNQSSGDIDGEILKGPYAGRQLSSLEREEMLALLDACEADDPRSVQLIGAYLDRAVGPEWRQVYEEHKAGKAGAGGGGGGSGPGAGSRAGSSPGGGMSREEALAVLGLGPAASRDEIKRAYNELMQKFHPDHGGTDYMAAKLNQARDVLLAD